MKVVLQENDSLLESALELEPDVVINDILDTDASYIEGLKKQNIFVVNFEDLGAGAIYADLVFNAIYPEKTVIKNHYYGQDYFCLRDEFIFCGKKEVKKDVKRVLLTFGGVDPSGITLRVLNEISKYCRENKIAIDVIVGPGNKQFAKIKEDFFCTNITLYKDVNNISEFMRNADIVFTSAGRTIYEVASIGTPTVVIAQNERELTHYFASSENGFANLGLSISVRDGEILKTFDLIVNNFEQRKYMSALMKRHNFNLSKRRVIKLIKESMSDVI